MAWPTFMHILRYPTNLISNLCFSKACADREPCGDSSHRLMEEACVAGPQRAYEVMHSQLESKRIIERNDVFPALASHARPISSIEVGVEIPFQDGFFRLIEDLCPLFQS